MADAHLSLTRRALLAGACTVPVLSAVEPKATEGRRPLLFSAPPAAGRPPSPFLPPDPPAQEGTATPPQGDGESFVVTNWDRALKRYEKAESALAAARTEDEALYDRLGTRHDRALQRLLLTAGPNNRRARHQARPRPLRSGCEFTADLRPCAPSGLATPAADLDASAGGTAADSPRPAGPCR
jgi:hypothetical protein